MGLVYCLIGVTDGSTYLRDETLKPVLEKICEIAAAAHGISMACVAFMRSDSTIAAYAGVPPERRGETLQLLRGIVERNAPQIQTRPHYFAGEPVHDDSGNVIGAVCLLDDAPRPDLQERSPAALALITRYAALVSANDALTGRFRLFAAAAEQAGDAIYFSEHRGTDRDPVIVYANSTFERMTGYRRRDVLGKSVLKTLYHEAEAATISAIRGAIKMTSPIALETAMRRPDGSMFVADVTFSPVFDEDGNCTHWISVRRDVTGMRKSTQHRIETANRERSEAQEALAYLSFHDVLTGLPNRSLVLARIAEDLGASAHGALLLFNLDRFRTVNDSFGRESGDAVLAEMSNRLLRCTPDRSIVARGDGDTFMMWIDRIETAAVKSLAGDLLREIERPIDIEHHSISLRASAGIAIATSERYGRPEEVIRDADVAMHHAKSLGGRRFTIFRDEIHGFALTRLRAESALQRAIDRGEFVNHYQPIVDLRTGQILALEALARWSDPERGIVPPGFFIPLAEQSGQVVAIGQRVLERACEDAVRCRLIAKHAGLRLNVNVSARQLSDEGFAARVFGVLNASRLPARALCLEVTETAVLEDFETAVASLGTLHSAGVRIAMDDFGTGYSSLANLRLLPFTSLKIDRQFISGNAEAEDIVDADIVQMIVSLGRARGLPVVAEGIETAMQAERARTFGCAEAQGYFFGRPVPIEDIRSLLASGTLNAALL